MLGWRITGLILYSIVGFAARAQILVSPQFSTTHVIPSSGVAGAPPPAGFSTVLAVASSVRQARAQVVASIGQSQGTFGPLTGTQPAPGLTYNALFLRDFFYTAEAFPGFYTASYVRAVVDGFAGSIGGDPLGTSATSPAERIDTGGVYRYRPGTSADFGWFPTHDSAIVLAYLTALVYERGDKTVYAARIAAVKAALDGLPRGPNGLIYSDPALLRLGGGLNRPTIGWGFEDSVISANSGELGIVSAKAVLAYQKLATLATAEGDTARAAAFTNSANTLISGLATLRLPDNLYQFSTGDAHDSIVLSSLIGAFGFAPPADLVSTATALTAQYDVANAVDYHGGVRWLIDPNGYTNAGSAGAIGQYQNGGYWLGAWTGWLASAINRISSTRATALLQAATNEVIAEGSTAPFEWFDRTTLKGVLNYTAAGGFLAWVADSGVPPTTPALVPATPTVLDDFSTSKLATDYFVGGGADWTVAGGILTNTGTTDGEFALWKTNGALSDVDISVKMRSTALTVNRFPTLVLRSGSTYTASSYINFAIAGLSGASGIYPGPAGALPSPLPFTFLNNTWYTLRVSLAAGSTVAHVYVNGTFVGNITFPSVPTVGYIGVAIEHGAGGGGAIDFDDLSITTSGPIPANFAVTSSMNGWGPGNAIGVVVDGTALSLRDSNGTPVSVGTYPATFH